MHLKSLVISVFAVLCAISGYGQDVGFTASIDRERVYVGESLILTLTISNGEPSNLTSFPEVENLQVQSLGTQSNLSWINGRQMMSKSYNYLLIPSQPGKYEIPAFIATVNGRIFSTQPQSFQALPRSNSGEPEEDADLYGAFLQAVEPPKEVYLGQVTPIEIRLYFREADNINLPQLGGDGWIFGKVQYQKAGRQNVNGKVYQLVIFETVAMPVRTGSLKLGPFKCDLSVPIEDPRSRSRRGGGFFGLGFGVQLQKVTLSTKEELIVTSKPLPNEDKPDSFFGAVGKFDLQVTPLSTEIQEGDPITLRLRVYGDGNFNNVSFPMVEQWNDFKSYPPEIKWDPQNKLETQGIKVFELTVVPNDREVTEIPEILWSYFDPEKEQYQTVKRGPYKIVVSPSENTPATPPQGFGSSPGGLNAESSVELAHIKPRLGSPVAFGAAWTDQTWFWALGGAPWLALLGFMGWARWVAPINSAKQMDPTRKLKLFWLKNCQSMKKDLENSDWRSFYSNLFRGMQMALGIYWSIPNESITEDSLEVDHGDRNLPEDTLEIVRELFRKCDQIRYAPLRGGLKEMKQDLPKVESLIEFVTHQLDAAKKLTEEE
jgi:hypothetical protein